MSYDLIFYLTELRTLYYIHFPMDTVLMIILILAIVITLFAVAMRNRKIKLPVEVLPGQFRVILGQQVEFYQQLGDEEKALFEKRVQQFLSTVRITGVHTTVEDIDKVLVAASAIIPIFAFPDWQYMNLHEVLLYPGSFNDKFEQEGGDRETLGVVGTGAYQNIMILSQYELREGFANKTGKTNTAIHEFVHLVDKTDGAVDGIPEIILSNHFIIPWLELMHKNIKAIKENESDINPYGATNQAEFFAVVSEYFFERPDLLRSKHPELYELLVKIFHQEPPTALKGE